MLNLEQLQNLAKLLEEVDISITNLEKSYSDNDSESFVKSKREILGRQIKIAEFLK